jgi:hypothetical protein
MLSELNHILFLDIETVACTDNFNTLDERLKTQWSRKTAYIKKDVPQTDEEIFHERAGIYAEFGKIVCIAVGKIFEKENGQLGLKTKVYAHHNEKILLEEFKAMLEKMDPTTLKLCAHNGKEFDFPYISRRMLVNSMVLPDVLNMMGKKPWEVAHLDTMEMWKFGDYKHFTSLDLLAALFDIPSSKAGIDGSQVNAVYYKEKNLEKIKLYCARDVIVLVQLYLRLRSLPILEAENIITA